MKPRAVHQLTAWLAALAVLLAPFSISAQPVDTMTEARQRYQTGKQLFDSGDYQGAVREFELANRLAPAPTLHFNIGLAYERLSQRTEALAHFRMYLEKLPNARNREMVEIKISRLESELGVAATPPAPVPTPVPGSVPIPTAPPSPVPPTTNPTPATPNPGFTTTTPPPVAEQAPVATGDPMLARVSAIDVTSVRDQRAPLMVAAVATASATAGQAEAAPSKPAYKSIWFWIVVGVSSLILLDVAAGG